jgi:hypothetical protein
MHEDFCACLARKHRDALSGVHVDRAKCAFSAFGVRLTAFTTAQAPATALATVPSSLTSGWADSTPETSTENKELALSGCRKHGGTIEVDSAFGEFTEFTIRLPRTHRTAAEAAS